MEESNDGILENIKNTYIPFLKKLISHLEKTKDNHPKTEKLKYVYNTFCDADSKEKITVYVACKDMLDKWYMRYKKRKGDKRSTVNDPQSEDSQETVSVKRKSANEKTFAASPAVTVQKSTVQRDGVSFQEEIEIESSDSSTSFSTAPGSTADPKTDKFQLNIKKEKVDPPLKFAAPVKATPVAVTPKPVNTPTVPVATPQESPAADKEIVFVCASCQFRTTVEADFMKHARTDHRTDLSLWCKKCGRCFSNAGVLVTHIKEDSCEKEEMIYRCGVKDCSFETASGQTFVHHLRHCHKGSPFIFCIHCQKIFTLPHCLILHMQNECPFKEKNRRDPSSMSANPPDRVQSPVIVKSAVVPKTPIQPAKIAPKPNTPIQPVSNTPQSGGQSVRRGSSILRGRGRARGGRPIRGAKFSDSSDSEDADDPSWRPEESLNNQPLRRSARWAKKVSDAKDPELYEAFPVSTKTKSVPEQPGKTFFYCPCCEFSALFKSLLLDHYVTDHKHQQRMSCLVCSVKFENKQLFLDHFTIHEKEKADGKSVSKPQELPASKEPALDSIPVEEVVPANLDKPTQVMKIPYQTAIQEKLQKETKLKCFEDLKTADDVLKMKTETKLQHFYKCVVSNCAFTTDDNSFFVKHVAEHHKSKKLHCGYCLNVHTSAETLANHMLKDHGKRFYQCSICFYRASSKPHVQIHMKNAHPTEKIQYFKCSQHLPPNYTFDKDVEDSDLTTTNPYVCAIGDCTLKTHDPKEFKKHNEIDHRSVTVFFCHYCKVDFISFKRLMSHYHLHGINNYQCTYCVHGSETKEEILLHLCNSHADRSLKVHVRAADNQANKKVVPENKELVVSNGEKNDDTEINSDASLEEYTDKTFTYPVEIKSLDKEIFCKLGFCGQLLENFHCYLKHLINDHNALNYVCPYCSAVTDSIAEFESHVLCHGPNLFACSKEKCYWFSSRENEVKHHMLNSHKNEATLVATVCRFNPNFVLPSLKIMSNNLPQLAKSGETSYVCPFCCYKCSNVGCMKNHLYEEMLYKRFQCNLCKVKMASRSDTKYHFKSLHSHHNIKCTIESNAEIETIVAFVLSAKLQQFITKCLRKENANCRVFSGFPPTKCKSCQVHLPTVRELHQHQVTCLSQYYEPYICDHCGNKASDYLSMKSHFAETHADSTIQFSTFTNKLLEEQQNRKLQDVRLTFLKDTAFCILNKSSLDNPKSVSKHYKCAYCKFVDSFRSNISKHCLGCHKDRDVRIEKIKESEPDMSAVEVDWSNQTVPMETVKPLNVPMDKDEPMDTSSKESYVCVYCMTSLSTLGELETHVQSSHQTNITDNVYPYFYCPDINAEFTVDDTALYECAYCSVSQENLYHLKRHCNNLHSAAIFQVRGHKSKDGAMLTCKYCECKVVSRDLLSKHCRFTHPGKPVRSSNDMGAKNSSVKRKKVDNQDSTANKRLKNTIVVYQCSYCPAEMDTIVKITSHQEVIHPNEEIKYTEACKDINDVLLNENMRYCNFCSFAGDTELLRRHTSEKHKSCVCCGHCDIYLASVDALSLHTSDVHKGLGVKQVDLSACDYDTGSADLNNSLGDVITPSAKTSMIYRAKLDPMFPKVVLKDYKK